ncbi:hypothetical protein O7622_07275 [Micromonospora sp. WMMD1076]|nr:hypothetical protein [Micromonospora sp. WMMD1076]WFF10166.1 hypothetical protein O7622_07275 [Micromonospora sp. WMMD1076]
MSQVRAERKDGIDESVRRLVEFALRQRPEFDGFHPAGQGVRGGHHAEEAGRAGEQVPARAQVLVDGCFDGQ